MRDGSAECLDASGLSLPRRLPPSPLTNSLIQTQENREKREMRTDSRPPYGATVSFELGLFETLRLFKTCKVFEFFRLKENRGESRGIRETRGQKNVIKLYAL